MAFGGRGSAGAVVGGSDFELFRGELERALKRSDRAEGGRPPYDAVLMFKVLVLQTLYTLSDDRPSISCVIGCRSCGLLAGTARAGTGREDDLALSRAIG